MTSIPAIAQVTSDGSTGTIVTPSGAVFDITGGTTVGGRNLFHSFERFDVPTLGEANFLNDAGIVNIFSRVTGGKVSEIDGVLRSQGSANLFLMNPSGIIFGQNASLDVKGSFVATTASGIQFGDRGTFSSFVSPVANVLTVDPSAFLFGQAPSAIVNRSINTTGATSPLEIPADGLRVLDGKSFVLLGGNIDIDGGKISALGGRVELGGLAEAGTVGLEIKNDQLRLSFPSDRVLSNLTLAKDARVAVRGAGGGEIVVNTNLFTATDGGRLTNGTEGAGDAGDTIVNANVFSAIGQGVSGNRAGLYNNTFGSGRSGNIIVTANQFVVKDGAVVVTESGQSSLDADKAFGNAGSIFLTIADLLEADGLWPTSNGFLTLISATTYSRGNGGNIDIKARDLRVLNGTQLISSTFGRGDAGNISITVRDAATFDGVGNNGVSSIVGSQVAASGTGRGGRLTLSSGSLTVKNGASLNSATFGRGDAGDVSLTVRDAATFDGVGSNGTRSSAGSTVNPTGEGKGGTLTVNAGSLVVSNGAQLTSATFGRGDAGDVALIVRDTATFDGVGSNGVSSIAGSTVEQTGEGKGGTLTVNAGSLTVSNGAQLTSATFGRGDAGDVALIVRDTATFDGVGSNGFSSSAGSTMNAVDVGRRGGIS
ncbi:MAG: filamentous hemagglutinin N-terminal domain-containing protein, partial [Leptolyngbya sp. UWPOB_LEPTO1]|uniref:two-partner secretion domain-containing protein n=1 Tax=Leptolyngbya sp. UWPOB_LEPTO1 TaxID=2815653 RepID=UPI001ACD6FF0